MKCPVIHEEEPEPSPVRGRLPVNNDRVDFSDYEWMGEELEEFDRKVINVLFFPDCAGRITSYLLPTYPVFICETYRFLN